MVSSVCAKYLPVLGLAGVLAGCPATGDEVRPPRDSIFFPTALAVDPQQSKLFVVNANSDLRYDSGSVVVMDLDTIDALVEDWSASGQVPEGRDCQRDSTLRSVLQCHEREAIPSPEAGVRIGNFATALGVQALASGDLRLFVPVRGDPSVTWIDYRDGELHCEGSEDVPLCDAPNRLVNMRNDLELPALINEPFGVHVDSTAGYVAITHLAQSAVSLIDAPIDGSRPPALVDAIRGLFLTESDEPQASLGVAGPPASPEGGTIYVTSRSENRVYMLYVLRRDQGTTLLPGEYFFLNDVRPSDDARGIVFNADGTRAYIVNRDPPMLQVLDTSLGPDGFPRNELAQAIELCREPSNVAVADTGRGERAYATCYPEGRILVIDPEAGIVEAAIDVGRGPHALVVAAERQRLYVTNFLEDTIAVVDLTPGAKTENQLVLRLGQPRQSGDE